MPPSPAVDRCFVCEKLKQPASPSVPALRLLNSPPMHWAQSSTTARPCRFAASPTLSMAHTMPKRCTTITAFVRGPHSASMARASMVWSSVTSQNTGTAPACSTAREVEMKV